MNKLGNLGDSYVQAGSKKEPFDSMSLAKFGLILHLLVDLVQGRVNLRFLCVSVSLL